MKARNSYRINGGNRDSDRGSLAGRAPHVIVTGGRKKTRQQAITVASKQLSPEPRWRVVGDLGNADGISVAAQTVSRVDLLVNNLGLFAPQTVRSAFDETGLLF